MASEHQRIALAALARTPNGTLTTVSRHGGPVDPAQYAAFKHGDGAAATLYGADLAAVVIDQVGTSTPLHVTSSGFGFVPPAAHALIGPFTRTARLLGADVTAFRVLRATVSNGDYAAMSLDQRQAAMSGHALSVHDHNLEGAHVIALDDVRVTGVHEHAMQDCLTRAGAQTVHHAYIIDAWQVRQDPSVESALNASAVNGDRALAALTHASVFTPNARFSKRVLTMGQDRLRAFLGMTPEWVGEWVLSAAELDHLDQYEAYREGVQNLREVLGARMPAVRP